MRIITKLLLVIASDLELHLQLMGSGVLTHKQSSMQVPVAASRAPHGSQPEDSGRALVV